MSGALLESLRAAVAEGRMPDPRARTELLGTTDPALVRRAGRVLAALGPDAAPPVPVVVSATCTIGPYEQILRAALVSGGVLGDLRLGAQGSFERDLVSGAFTGPDAPRFVTVLMDESFFVPRDWTAAESALNDRVRARLAELRAAVARTADGTAATLILHTIPLPAEMRDGLVSRRARTRLTRLWHRVNDGLLELAEEHDRVETVDLAGLLSESPFAARDDRMHRYGELPYTDGALLLLAQEVRRVVQAVLGLSRKVLALDLDGTLWGGVLGEVGVAGVELGGLYPGNCYLALQRAVLRLREQGVILVLASKNDTAPVEEALNGHPEMLLRSEAFAVRAVDWSSKAANLRAAADALSLPPSSFVFMDDTKFEREEVATLIPEVAVVPSDGDPAHLVRSLLRGGWFDVPALTDTDRLRADLYLARVQRTGFSAGFGTETDYLHALEIKAEISPATEFTVPRAAQLAARTNQFNLTGRRFDEAETAEMSAAPDHLVATVSASDRFGSEGVVGALWAERRGTEWRVLNMVLSCRVLGRGIERAAVAWLAARAAEAGAERIVGTYLPSRRNTVAAGFWPDAGFKDAGGGEYVLEPVAGVEGTPSWITLTERMERT